MVVPYSHGSSATLHPTSIAQLVLPAAARWGARSQRSSTRGALPETPRSPLPLQPARPSRRSRTRRVAARAMRRAALRCTTASCSATSRTRRWCRRSCSSMAAVSELEGTMGGKGRRHLRTPTTRFPLSFWPPCFLRQRRHTTTIFAPPVSGVLGHRGQQRQQYSHPCHSPLPAVASAGIAEAPSIGFASIQARARGSTGRGSLLCGVHRWLPPLPACPATARRRHRGRHCQGGAPLRGRRRCLVQLPRAPPWPGRRALPRHRAAS